MGLKIAKHMNIKNIIVFGNFTIIIEHIIGQTIPKDNGLCGLLSKIQLDSLSQIQLDALEFEESV